MESEIAERREQTSALRGMRSSQDLMPSFLTVVFLGIVVCPVLLAGLYYYLVASDRYVSEAAFIVRGISSGGQSGGLSAVFRTVGINQSTDDTFAVNQFIQSRDAVRGLNERRSLKDIFSGPNIDVLSAYPRFWRLDSFEGLYDYYLNRIEVIYSSTTGITTLRVRAFKPEDAFFLASNLLQLSEALVNRMNQRAIADSLSFAQDQVALAEKKVVSAQNDLTKFRNSELILDPTAASLKVFELIGQLTSDLTQTRLQLNETLRSAPSSPAIQGLRVRINALEEQIASERSKMVGGNDALASKVAAYERLVLAREFADRNLGTAFTSLEAAREEARHKQLYIETVVEPNLADESIEPRRARLVITVGVVSLVLFCLIWLVIAGSKEHMHG